MTIDLDGGTGLFDRLGKMFYCMELVESFTAGSASDNLPTELNDVLGEFDAESDNNVRAAVDGLVTALGSLQQNSGTFHDSFIEAAEKTLIEMADADNPLTSKTVEVALEELIRQMETNSESVDANEPSSSETAASGNDGDGVVVVSLLDGRGKSLENAFQEDILCTVSSTATKFSENWRCAGERNLATRLSSVFWPSGSSSAKTITTIDPASNNLLSNAAFESFTTNAPDSWTIDTGTAGTTIDDETSNVYRGSSALKFIGNGSELTAISQERASSLSSLTPYLLHARIRVDGAAPAAGELTIDLYDGTGVIADEQSANNSLAIDLTAESSTYAAHTAVFRLPDPKPDAVHLRIRLSTALSNTKNVFIDDLCLVAMTQLYAGGPYISFVTGDAAFSIDDEYSIAITNDGRGKFQTRFRQVFDQPTLLLPSNAAGSESINDSLIG